MYWYQCKAVQFLRSDLERATRRWREQRRGDVAEKQREKPTSHSGRIGCAAALAVDCTEQIIQSDGRWSSDTFMTYVREMEDSRWASRSLLRISLQENKQVRYMRLIYREYWGAVFYEARRLAAW